jgi:hypothetical protein
MFKKPDLDTIKAAYEFNYNKAIRLGLSSIEPYLLDWASILNTPHLAVFNDARSIGVPLYPYYPIGNRFIHLGNPFKKIGIEIIYKGDSADDKKERWDSFKQDGWTIYSIKSSDTFFTINDLYQQVKDLYGDEEELGSLNDDDYNNFINEYKEKNSECLMYYIRAKHFTPIYSFEEDDY